MNRTLVTWTRTIHIYLTLAALALMLLFAVTGFTINHEDWFGATTPVTRNVSGLTPSAMLQPLDKLKVVEYLRANFQATGAMTDFDSDDDHHEIVFKSPGRICKAVISRPDGKTEMEVKTFGLTARLNDLHRGRDAGEPWRWVIDASAALILLASITGIILWIALPKRRKLGILALVLGTALTVALYLTLVP
jgi:hypothetical protein